MKSILLLFATVFFCVGHVGRSAIEVDRPDMVLFIADDLSIDDCALYGNTEIATPNLDALAREGLTFDRAYVASPSCAPSRAALLTGNYGVRTGAMYNHQLPREDVRKWPSYFQEQGYEVVAIGKVAHYAQVTSYGFDHASSYKFHEDDCVRKAVQWLKRRKSDQPLCLIVGTNWPHTPWPKRGTLDPDSLHLAPKLADTPETRVARSRYAAAVSNADRDLGLMWQAVKEYLPTETLFVFSSDHGSPFPFSKWNLYEDGVHVPLVVSWPGRVPTGQRTAAMVSWVDFMPTLLEAAGADPRTAAPHIDGRSFLPVVTGGVSEHREKIFAAHSGDGSLNFYPARSVRVGRWKYIRNLDPSLEFHSHIDRKWEGTGFWPSWERAAKHDAGIAGLVASYLHRPAEELYDLETDPDEIHNLASDPARRGILTQLRAEVRAWMASIDDQGLPTEMANHPRPRRAN